MWHVIHEPEAKNLKRRIEILHFVQDDKSDTFSTFLNFYPGATQGLRIKMKRTQAMLRERLFTLIQQLYTVISSRSFEYAVELRELILKIFNHFVVTVVPAV